MADNKMGGKFGARYGRKIRARIVAIEKKQRAKQECPGCGKAAKRVGVGIFECPKCGKFTGGAYYVK
jgi:large subunit ribosomal protein L37Ae